MPAIVRALRHRDFRLYFAGQLVSLLGTWMQQVAMSWLAYRLTGSVLLLGLVGFAGQIPILFLAPFGGLWSDRVNRRSLLIASQFAAMLQALALAALTASGAIEPWHLVVLALLLGMINAVDIPARQSLLVHLVGDRRDLPNAIALNSFTVHSARLLGPMAAGLLVSLVGEATCFALNGLSYLTVLLALLAIRAGNAPAAPTPALQALRQGFAVAWAPPIRALLLLVAAISFFATPYTVLMPVFAREVYGGDARTLGLLLACAGAGALASSVYLAARPSMHGLERALATAALLAGTGLASFALGGRLWLAVPSLVLVGAGIIGAVAGANTLIQSLVRDEVRGRVMSIFTMAFLGTAPLGSLAGGAFADAFGAPATLALGGLACAGAGLLFRREREAFAAAVAHAELAAASASKPGS